MKPELLWKKKMDLMNLHSKASWNKNKASETLKFICFTERGLGGFHLNNYVNIWDNFLVLKRFISVTDLI